MSRALQGRRLRSVSVHGCEDQRETKSALLNKLPKKFPTHSGARGWLRRCSDWWALPGRPAPLAQGVPMAPSCSCSLSCPWQPSWQFGMGTEPAPFQAREWGQHPPHQDPRESNPDELTCGRSLTTGVWRSRQACKKVWVAGQGSALHAHLRNLISSPQPWSGK